MGIDFATARVCPSLVQLRDEFIVQHSDRRKLSTLSKYIKAVEVFTAHFRCKDFRLHEINRTMVTDWLDNAKLERATQTLANYLGCLSQLVALAQNRYHDAPKRTSSQPISWMCDMITRVTSHSAVMNWRRLWICLIRR